MCTKNFPTGEPYQTGISARNVSQPQLALAAKSDEARIYRTALSILFCFIAFLAFVVALVPTTVNTYMAIRVNWRMLKSTPAGSDGFSVSVWTISIMVALVCLHP